MTKPMSIAEGVEPDLAGADRELQSEDAYRRDGHSAFVLTLARRAQS
jgi:hypothetical protein